jgi:hypothetical protein
MAFLKIPHPALRATFSRREKDNRKAAPLPPGEGGPKRRVRDFRGCGNSRFLRLQKSFNLALKLIWRL